MKKYNHILILFTLIAIYYLCKYILPYGVYIIYPINLLVTVMHEFGHAFFALITGGSVESIQINTDGSGLATTSGGIRSIILLGGYIGSAIIGNMLLYISIKKTNISEIIMYIIGFGMIGIGIIWFDSIFSLLILIILGGGIILLAKYSRYDAIILQFIAITSLLFIIEDYNLGPSSDIAKFSDIFIIIPDFIWSFVWLLLVLGLTYFNIKKIIKL